jgi:hypothetical protein
MLSVLGMLLNLDYPLVLPLSAHSPYLHQPADVKMLAQGIGVRNLFLEHRLSQHC